MVEDKKVFLGTVSFHKIQTSSLMNLFQLTLLTFPRRKDKSITETGARLYGRTPDFRDTPPLQNPAPNTHTHAHTPFFCNKASVNKRWILVGRAGWRLRKTLWLPNQCFHSLNHSLPRILAQGGACTHTHYTTLDTAGVIHVHIQKQPSDIRKPSS